MLNPPAQDSPLLSLFGALFFTIVFTTSAWALWHRRHAWGWWESPITMANTLLAIGVLALLPMIFWRDNSWWAWMYLLSYMSVMAGLGYFIVALKRRQQHGPLPNRWLRNHVLFPYLFGTLAAWYFFFTSGAWHNPHLLHQDFTTHNWTTPEAFAFWIACDTVGFYSFMRIAILLLALRADSRRGDRRNVNIYLGSATAGMTVCVIGVIAGIHDKTSAITLAIIMALVFLMSTPQIVISAISWRSKHRKLLTPDQETTNSQNSISSH